MKFSLRETALLQINVVNVGLKNMIDFFPLKLGILLLLVYLGLVPSKHFRKSQNKRAMILNPILHIMGIFLKTAFMSQIRHFWSYIWSNVPSFLYIKN